MITSFRIQTPAGGREVYSPGLIVGNRVYWTRETDQPGAPIDTRLLPVTARRRDVVAAFRK